MLVKIFYIALFFLAFVGILQDINNRNNNNGIFNSFSFGVSAMDISEFDFESFKAQSKSNRNRNINRIINREEDSSAKPAGSGGSSGSSTEMFEIMNVHGNNRLIKEREAAMGGGGGPASHVDISRLVTAAGRAGDLNTVKLMVGKGVDVNAQGMPIILI